MPLGCIDFTIHKCIRLSMLSGSTIKIVVTTGNGPYSLTVHLNIFSLVEKVNSNFLDV
jgi:hypothetical protein